MGPDQNAQQGQQQVRPATQKKALIEVQQEKEVLLEVRPEFVDTNHPSTSGQVKTMLERFEQLIRKPPMKKVSKLKEFFNFFLSLINNKDVVAELTTLIE